MGASLITLLTAFGLVVPTASALAFVLYRARIPGDRTDARTPGACAAIVGGILAGILLGPGVLGAVWPDAHRSVFMGDSAEVRAQRVMESEHRAARMALRATGVSEVAVDELRAEQEAAALVSERAVTKAQRERALLLGLWGAVPLFVAIGAGLGVCGGRPAARRRGDAVVERVRHPAMQAGWMLCAFGFTLLVARLFVDSWMPALVFAMGMSVVGVPPLGRGAGFASSVAGNAIAFPLVAPGVVGWLGGRCGAWAVGVPRARRRRAVLGVVYGVLLPGLVGLAVATIDPGSLVRDRVFAWYALLAFLLGADLRWAALAWSRVRGAGARRWWWAGVQIEHGTALLQAGGASVLVLVGGGMGIGEAHGVGAALLIGAVTIRLGNAIRGGMARALDGDGDGVS
ncbi:MAG: hypothetical protein ACTS3F_08205 [Phycisphaerales bacterium]